MIVMTDKRSKVSHSTTHPFIKILIKMSLIYGLAIAFQVKVSFGVMASEKTMMENQK